jgi:hypothetical protein
MLNRGWLFLVPAGVCFVASCMSPFSRVWAVVAVFAFVIAGVGWMVMETERQRTIKSTHEHEEEFVGAVFMLGCLLALGMAGSAFKDEDGSYMPVTLSRTVLGVASGITVVCGIRVFVIERALEREGRQRSPDR